MTNRTYDAIADTIEELQSEEFIFDDNMYEEVRRRLAGQGIQASDENIHTVIEDVQQSSRVEDYESSDEAWDIAT